MVVSPLLSVWVFHLIPLILKAIFAGKQEGYTKISDDEWSRIFGLFLNHENCLKWPVFVCLVTRGRRGFSSSGSEKSMSFLPALSAFNVLKQFVIQNKTATQRDCSMLLKKELEEAEQARARKPLDSRNFYQHLHHICYSEERLDHLPLMNTGEGTTADSAKYLPGLKLREYLVHRVTKSPFVVYVIEFPFSEIFCEQVWDELNSARFCEGCKGRVNSLVRCSTNLPVEDLTKFNAPIGGGGEGSTLLWYPMDRATPTEEAMLSVFSGLLRRQNAFENLSGNGGQHASLYQPNSLITNAVITSEAPFKMHNDADLQNTRRDEEDALSDVLPTQDQLQTLTAIFSDPEVWKKKSLRNLASVDSFLSGPVPTKLVYSEENKETGDVVQLKIEERIWGPDLKSFTTQPSEIRVPGMALHWQTQHSQSASIKHKVEWALKQQPNNILTRVSFSARPAAPPAGDLKVHLDLARQTCFDDDKVCDVLGQRCETHQARRKIMDDIAASVIQLDKWVHFPNGAMNSLKIGVRGENLKPGEGGKGTVAKRSKKKTDNQSIGKAKEPTTANDVPMEEDGGSDGSGATTGLGKVIVQVIQEVLPKVTLKKISLEEYQKKGLHLVDSWTMMKPNMFELACDASVTMKMLLRNKCLITVQDEPDADAGDIQDEANTIIHSTLPIFNVHGGCFSLRFRPGHTYTESIVYDFAGIAGKSATERFNPFVNASLLEKPFAPVLVLSQPNKGVPESVLYTIEWALKMSCQEKHFQNHANASDAETTRTVSFSDAIPTCVKKNFDWKDGRILTYGSQGSVSLAGAGAPKASTLAKHANELDTTDINSKQSSMVTKDPLVTVVNGQLLAQKRLDGINAGHDQNKVVAELVRLQCPVLLFCHLNKFLGKVNRSTIAKFPHISELIKKMDSDQSHSMDGRLMFLQVVLVKDFQYACVDGVDDVPSYPLTLSDALGKDSFGKATGDEAQAQRAEALRDDLHSEQGWSGGFPHGECALEVLLKYRAEATFMLKPHLKITLLPVYQPEVWPQLYDLDCKKLREVRAYKNSVSQLVSMPLNSDGIKSAKADPQGVQKRMQDFFIRTGYRKFLVSTTDDDKMDDPSEDGIEEEEEEGEGIEEAERLAEEANEYLSTDADIYSETIRLLTWSAYVQMAGCLRFMGRSLTQNSQATSCSLKAQPLDEKFLPVILRVFPIHAPSRELNVIAMAIMTNGVCTGILKPSRDDEFYVRTQFPESGLTQENFSGEQQAAVANVVLLTMMAGNLPLFLSFRELCVRIDPSSRHGNIFGLLSLDQKHLSLFRDFLSEVEGTGVSLNTMKTTQYKDSLPKNITSNAGEVISALTKLVITAPKWICQAMSDLRSEMAVWVTTESPNPLPKPLYKRVAGEIMRFYPHQNQDRWDFFAQNIVENLKLLLVLPGEEFYHAVLSNGRRTIKELIPGLKEKMSETSTNLNSHARMVYASGHGTKSFFKYMRARAGADPLRSMKVAYESICDELRRAPEELLHTLGFERVNHDPAHDGVIIHRLIGSLITPVSTVESMACCFWQGVKYTSPHFGTSSMPNLFNNHNHPLVLGHAKVSEDLNNKVFSSMFKWESLEPHRKLMGDELQSTFHKILKKEAGEWVFAKPHFAKLQDQKVDSVSGDPSSETSDLSTANLAKRWNFSDGTDESLSSEDSEREHSKRTNTFADPTPAKRRKVSGQKSKTKIVSDFADLANIVDETEMRKLYSSKPDKYVQRMREMVLDLLKVVVVQVETTTAEYPQGRTPQKSHISKEQSNELRVQVFTKNQWITHLIIKTSGLEDAGRGLFAGHDFREDEFVGYYIGDFKQTELSEIEKQYAVEFRSTNSTQAYIVPNVNDNTQVYAGVHYANDKFFNHTMEERRIMESNKVKYKSPYNIQLDKQMRVYTTKNISRGEEMFLDYQLK